MTFKANHVSLIVELIKKRESNMNTFFATSIEHLVTTKDGDKFLVSSSFAGSDGDTAKESVDNAIASYEKAGHTAEDLMSITTVELDA